VEQEVDISSFNFFNYFIDDSDKIEFLKQQLDQQGIVRNLELQLKTQESSPIEVILTANIIGDFRQDAFGYLFLFKDITELKKIQQQLLQSQKLESVGLMASGIAHDFNNILAAIIPNSELIKISSKAGEPNYKRAEIIEKSAHRASEIAQRLLTFTRQGDQGHHDVIDLNKVVDESIEMMDHRLTKDIEIIKSYHPRLKYIFGDASQVQQIIINLLINAADAMPDGGAIKLVTENYRIDHHYQIGALDPGEYIRITIQDTGVGIPLDVISKIFDPFFTTKDIGKGTGLGLSVVYGIVKSLKGHIEVSSRIKEGTIFDIYFPVEDSSKESEVVEEIHQMASKNLKLLIVDDEDYVLNILADTLDYLGYDVKKFTKGQDALDFYKQNRNDIKYAIIDLKMPHMDGRTVSNKLREINPDLKIIFTSGFDDQPINGEDQKGVVGFLKKPYSIKKVSSSLEGILASE
jgi:signal transduction histidine kinase